MRSKCANPGPKMRICAGEAIFALKRGISRRQIILSHYEILGLAWCVYCIYQNEIAHFIKRYGYWIRSEYVQ